jgi:hypothetical protein
MCLVVGLSLMSLIFHAINLGGDYPRDKLDVTLRQT